MTMQSIMNQVKNSMRHDTSTLVNQNKSFKIGTVTGFNPNDYTVKIDFKPYSSDNVIETSWMPIASLHAGANRGVLTPPQLGDQAIVAFGDGAYQSGVVIGYIFSNADRAPNVGSGSFLLQIGTGSDSSTIEINEDGSLNIQSSQTVTIKSPAITISSDGGDAGFLAKFQELKAAYDAHTHTDSGGTTGVPVQPLPTNVSTTVLKGE